jgi:prolyl 4-hydroxylase
MYLTLTGTSINILLLSQLLIHTEGVVGFAGGGFGGGFGASKSKTSKKPRKNRKKGGLTSAEFIDKSPATKRDVIGEEPKLDRFGLPILTAENFFPKLPPQTELECASKDEETNMESIRKAMANYIPLDFDLFDDAGAEKESACEQPWKLKLLHKSPPVLAIENFFTDAECEEYIELTKTPEKSLDDKRSDDGDNACNDESSALKIESATFSTLAHSKRTSTTWYCHYRQVPTLLAKARRLLNGLALEQMEEPQVVRYRTGEEFSWHYDEIPREQLTNGGQRIATLLVYLNTLSDTGGGGTIFRDLTGLDGIGELTMRPKKGSALLFFPACADGTPDDRTLHKGEVAVEEKTIAQMWIHERAYNAIVPEGNSHEAAIDVVKEKEVELGYK